MTTRTSKLVVVQNKTASPEAATATGAAGADGHSHAEICPTCGQPRLFLQPAAPAAVEQTPLLAPPAAAATTAVCLNEHEADET